MEARLERSIGNHVDWSGLQIAYNTQTDERLFLAKNLATITKTLFGNPYRSNNDRLYKQQSNLIAAFDEIGRNNASAPTYSYFAVYCRVEAIQEHLSTAIPLFNALWEEVSNDDLTPWASEEGKLIRRIKRYVKRLDYLTKTPLSLAEINTLERRLTANEPAIITLRISELHPQLTLHLSPFLEPQLKGDDMGYMLKNATSSTEHTLREWLEALSTDVLKEYNKTEEILSEVTPLLDNAEDEYFVEQISTDYYPHIFDALLNFHDENTDFNNKEEVVTEAVKQFRIIQLGLQRIIEGTVSRHMNAMRSQTGFLRNKVLGEHNLSLSPIEADELVESSVEEVQRMRDDLYKKHVTPTLEKNKQEYDAALIAAQQDHAAQLEIKEQENAEAKAAFEEKLQVMEAQYLESQEIFAQQLLELQSRLIVAQEDFEQQLEAKDQEALATQEELNQRIRTLEQLPTETKLFKEQLEDKDRFATLANYEAKVSAITQEWDDIERLNMRIREMHSLRMEKEAGGAKVTKKKASSKTLSHYGYGTIPPDGDCLGCAL